jgi:TolA-binding protein
MKRPVLLLILLAGCQAQPPSPDDLESQLRALKPDAGKSAAERGRAMLRLTALLDNLAAEDPARRQALLGGAYRDALWEVALANHKQAQRQKDDQTYRLVLDLYQAFLAHFPQDKQAVRAQFYRGEALWVLESWRPAALAYEDVIRRDPAGEQAVRVGRPSRRIVRPAQAPGGDCQLQEPGPGDEWLF